MGGEEPLPPDHVAADPMAIHFILNELDYNHPKRIFSEDLPGKRVIRSYKELVQRGLIGSVLTPKAEKRPWASGFFPSWFGGAAGRWQQSRVVLFLRSLFGIETLDREDALNLLSRAASDAGAANRLYELAPTEKYDLAVGDYGMLATRFEALARGHTMKNMVLSIPFWNGLCNGMAISASRYDEPVREVDVINPEGFRVRFHPNDIKALLGVVQAVSKRRHWQVGTRCDDYRTDTRACWDINPASLVITLANRLGIAGKSFVIDVNPLAPVINAAIRSARITVTRPPYVPDFDIFPANRLVAVRIDLETSSTLLGASESNVRLPGEGVFAKVSGGSKWYAYEAELAIKENDDIVGGRWTGWRLSGPDFAWGVPDEPSIDVQIDDHVIINPFLRYSAIVELARASTSPAAERPLLDLRPLMKSWEPDLFAVRMADSKVKLFHGKLVSLSGSVPSRFGHMSCFCERKDGNSPGDSFAINQAFSESAASMNYFVAEVDVPDRDATQLRCELYERGGGPPVLSRVIPIVEP